MHHPNPDASTFILLLTKMASDADDCVGDQDEFLFNGFALLCILEQEHMLAGILETYATAASTSLHLLQFCLTTTPTQFLRFLKLFSSMYLYLPFCI